MVLVTRTTIQLSRLFCSNPKKLRGEIARAQLYMLMYPENVVL